MENEPDTSLITHGCKFDSSSHDLITESFEKCTFTDMTMSQEKLSTPRSFYDCSFKNIFFSGSPTGRAFSGHRFERCYFGGCDFSGMKLHQVEFHTCDFSICDFYETRMYYTKFMTHAKSTFIKCSLKDALFHYCEFQVIKFSNCFLLGALLDACEVSGPSIPEQIDYLSELFSIRNSITGDTQNGK